MELPLGSTADVIGNGYSLGLEDKYAGAPYTYTIRQRATDNTIALSADGVGQALPYQDSTGYDTPHADYVYGVSTDPTESGLIADLSSATAATINTVRMAFQVQKMLERDARGGTRS